MTNNKADILNKLNTRECTTIFKDSGINIAIIFGSILTEDFNEYSDIDIAVLSEKDIRLHTILNLEGFLQKFLGRDIDIINLKDKNLDLNLKVEIYDNGNIIYGKEDLKLYNKDYLETEQLYKENETYRFFRERDVISSE